MTSEVLEHGEVIPKQVGPLDRGLAHVENALGLIAALFILILMLLGVAQIVVRVIWNLPIPGYIDYVELLMAVVAFAAIGYAERLGGHIRMDFLPNLLTGKSRIFIEMVLVIIALVAVSILVYATWFSFQRAWDLGDSTMDIRIPIWPSKLLLCIALSLLWFRLALSVIGFGRSLVFRDDTGKSSVEPNSRKARSEKCNLAR